MHTLTSSCARSISRRRLAGLLLPILLLLANAGAANAANVRSYSTFACNWADYVQSNAVTVYFPDLYTSSGVEAVSYSPDLYKYTSAGWQPWDQTKPWYSAIVTTSGIRTSGGFKWSVNAANPAYATGFRNVQFQGLSPGWYAVKGYFYGGTSHWASVYGTSSTSCYVS